jgi:hypothetical protein
MTSILFGKKALGVRQEVSPLPPLEHAVECHPNAMFHNFCISINMVLIRMLETEIMLAELNIIHILCSCFTYIFFLLPTTAQYCAVVGNKRFINASSFYA